METAIILTRDPSPPLKTAPMVSVSASCPPILASCKRTNCASSLGRSSVATRLWRVRQLGLFLKKTAGSFGYGPPKPHQKSTVQLAPRSMSTLGLLSRRPPHPERSGTLLLVKAATTRYKTDLYREKGPAKIKPVRNYCLWICSCRLCRRTDRVSQFQ